MDSNGYTTKYPDNSLRSHDRSIWVKNNFLVVRLSFFNGENLDDECHLEFCKTTGGTLRSGNKLESGEDVEKEQSNGSPGIKATDVYLLVRVYNKGTNCSIGKFNT